MEVPLEIKSTHVGNQNIISRLLAARMCLPTPLHARPLPPSFSRVSLRRFSSSGQTLTLVWPPPPRPPSATFRLQRPSLAPYWHRRFPPRPPASQKLPHRRCPCEAEAASAARQLRVRRLRPRWISEPDSQRRGRAVTTCRAGQQVCRATVLCTLTLADSYFISSPSVRGVRASKAPKGQKAYFSAYDGCLQGRGRKKKSQHELLGITIRGGVTGWSR